MDQPIGSSTTDRKKESNASLIKEILAIVVLSIVLAFTYNAFSTRSIPLIRVAPKKIATADSDLFSATTPISRTPVPTDTVTDSATHRKIPVFAPIQKKAIERPDSVKKSLAKKNQGYSVVTLDQVKKLLEQHKGVFVDARSEDDYAEGHIIGSRNIPFDDVDKHFEEVMTTIPQDTLVVIYCTGPDCHLGRGLADWMLSMEFKRIYLFDDGWDGWVKAKMPFEGTKAKK